MVEQELTEEYVVRAVYGYAAELMKANLSGPQIEQKLMEKGLDQESASIVVENLSSIRINALMLIESGKKNMLYGALWCIGGLLVTAMTFLAANGGGIYIIAYGAIIGGAIQFFTGLSRYSEGTRLLE